MNMTKERRMNITHLAFSLASRVHFKPQGACPAHALCIPATIWDSERLWLQRTNWPVDFCLQQWPRLHRLYISCLRWWQTASHNYLWLQWDSRQLQHKPINDLHWSCHSQWHNQLWVSSDWQTTIFLLCDSYPSTGHLDTLLAELCAYQACEILQHNDGMSCKCDWSLHMLADILPERLQSTT